MRSAWEVVAINHTHSLGMRKLTTFTHTLLHAVLPDRALRLPTFSHLFIVNKLLSLSLSLSAVNAGARAPRGGVTRQGVVLTDLQLLRDCQYNFSVSLSLTPSLPPSLSWEITSVNQIHWRS
jgi:hypothetical protein